MDWLSRILQVYRGCEDQVLGQLRIVWCHNEFADLCRITEVVVHLILVADIYLHYT